MAAGATGGAVQIVVDFRLEARKGRPEVGPAVVPRPGRRIDGLALRHGLVHHVEDGLKWEPSNTSRMLLISPAYLDNDLHLACLKFLSQ